jgi:uncharacterized membrane protein
VNLHVTGRLLIVFCAVINFAACNYSILKHPVSQGQIPQSFKASELSFSSVYQKVFLPNCVGCHGNGGGINLETYPNVMANLLQIKQAAVDGRSMPKSPGLALTGDQIGLLNAWILAGAPEAASDGNPDPPPATLEPTFVSIQTNILQPKCVLCHAPGQPVERIPLVTKEDLLNSPLDIVIPGNPDESGIVLAIQGANPRKIMPPPKDASGNPTGFVKLSDAEITAIVQWITNGAKD